MMEWDIFVEGEIQLLKLGGSNGMMEAALDQESGILALSLNGKMILRKIK